MTADQKKAIDEMDYEAMLRLWRNAAVGQPLFQCETGDYYGKVMAIKRSQDPGAHVAASKMIGWER